MNQFKDRKLQKTFLQSLLGKKKDIITDEERDRFQIAFVHSSLIQRYGPDNVKKVLGCREDYERIEYLGDRVMELVSGEYLFDQTRGQQKFKCPVDEWGDEVEWKDDSPNFLTRAKSRMVKKEAFAALAAACGFGPYICVVSKDYEDYEGNEGNEIYGGGGGGNNRTVHSKSIMEDCFEAFVGICYQCFGFDRTRDWVQNIIIKYSDWDKIMFDNNYKDKILRYYTSIQWGHPEYAEINKEEVEYRKWEFTSCVLSPIPIKGMPPMKVSQFQSPNPNSRKKVWLLEGSSVPVEEFIIENMEGKKQEFKARYVSTGSSGYIAGIGKGRKLKDAEQDASLNAMINFGSLIEF